jgi:pyruvate dehydrogenase E2 component (dihydrolipoamide acetyltransferase)
MIKEVRMPNIGTNIDEMKIIRWFKAPGDEIQRGDILFEVETDKAVMEVESYLAGYLKKIIVRNGDAAPAGGVVAIIGDRNDDLEEFLKFDMQNPLIADNCVIKTEEKVKQVIRISPMVKKIAENWQVDYTKLIGTGPNGIITKEDLKAAAKKEQDKKIGPDKKKEQTGKIEPFNRIARATAKAMTQSKTTIPHAYFEIDIDASAMKAFRKNNDKAISYNAMIVKASGSCLKKYPYLAAQYSEDGRIMKSTINIGLAVAKMEDLLVPVIKNVSEKTLYEIEKDINILLDKTRKNELIQDDLNGSIFTVTNLGGYGVSAFTAVINSPEVAIIAVGEITPRIVPAESGFSVVPTVRMTLSVDHRMVNGTYAAGFLKELKNILERMEI